MSDFDEINLDADIWKTKVRTRWLFSCVFAPITTLITSLVLATLVWYGKHGNLSFDFNTYINSLKLFYSNAAVIVFSIIILVADAFLIERDLRIYDKEFAIKNYPVKKVVLVILYMPCVNILLIIGLLIAFIILGVIR